MTRFTANILASKFPVEVRSVRLLKEELDGGGGGVIGDGSQDQSHVSLSIDYNTTTSSIVCDCGQDRSCCFTLTCRKIQEAAEMKGSITAHLHSLGFQFQVLEGRDTSSSPLLTKDNILYISGGGGDGSNGVGSSSETLDVDGSGVGDGGTVQPPPAPPSPTSRTTLYLDGLNCGNCADSIKSVLGNLDGVVKCNVTLSPIQKAVVEYHQCSSSSTLDSSISIKSVRRKIEDLGFKLIAFEVTKYFRESRYSPQHNFIQNIEYFKS